MKYNKFTYQKSGVNISEADKFVNFISKIQGGKNIIIKRWDDQFIHLQGQGLPIDCFYHVYAERKDVNPLLTEYEGNSRYDYPDPNFSEKSDIPIEERNYTDPNYKFPRTTYTV